MCGLAITSMRAVSNFRSCERHGGNVIQVQSTFNETRWKTSQPHPRAQLRKVHIIKRLLEKKIFQIS